MTNSKITYNDELSLEHKTAIVDGLNRNAYLKRKLGKNNASFSFIIENNKGEFQAGISGFNYYGCFYIDLLFVEEKARGQGLGSRLMAKAEELARHRKCLFMAVNTMDFEAKPFYEKHGYKVELERTGYENGARGYFLKKEL